MTSDIIEAALAQLPAVAVLYLALHSRISRVERAVEDLSRLVRRTSERPPRGDDTPRDRPSV